MKKILTATLGLLLAFSATIQAGEMYEGSSALKLLIGNTLEANYINAGECGRHVFYEYYDKDGKIFGQERKKEQSGDYTHYVGSWELKDGKLCTSVYGRPYSCTTYEKVGEDTFKRNSDKMLINDVKIHKGKYRPCL
ncbi:MAG: hypothetical protein ACI9DG_000805 [Oleispira sp.]|jgi:hypothetical protein